MFDKRDYFRPFDYPWAFEYYRNHESMHWLPTELSYSEDVKDFKINLSVSEKNLIENVLKFFTTADIDVASGYLDYYLPIFKNPEIRLALTSIAARECIHQDAYSVLIEELALGEDTYKVFTSYKEMVDKHEFLFSGGTLAENIAKISVFSEGLQLFGSFVILLNFSRFGLMKNMGQIISWSIRDETLHAEFMIRVFNEIGDRPESINEICKTMVDLEDRFIDLCFANFEIRGLDKNDVKKYIRYVADVRMKQIGYKPQYGIDENPLPWVDEIVFGKEYVNFFETKATDYSKGAIEGSWEDAF